MVDVRHVGVIMRDGLVPVRVGVSVVEQHVRMHVQMVPVIVTMPVVVIEGLVYMRVMMPFAQQ